jgi:predicted nucleotidyltransferase
MYSLSDVQRLIRAERSRSGIRNTLERLTEHGLVLTERFGKTDAYRLNREHILAGPVLAIAASRNSFIERVRSRLASWSHPALYAALFGSAARGDMSTNSDIDLFLVHPDDVDFEEWTDAVQQLQLDMAAWTGNDTRVLEMSETEAESNVGVDPVLISIATERILLLGSSDWGRNGARRGLVRS